MLAALLVRRGRAVSSDTLIDDVWGPEPPDTARKALQGHISRLRRRLGRDVLVTHGSGYELIVPDGALDIDEVEAALRDDAEGTGDRCARLRAALTHWRGEPYAGIPGPAVETERMRLEELRSTLLERLAESELASGRTTDAIEHLERLVQEHPYREHDYALLMHALQRSGRQADALAVYQRARAVLVEDLGLDPGAELQGLQSRILRGEFETRSADVDAAQPRTVVSKPLAGPLPMPLSRFVGREEELALVADQLDEHRLVTLVGPGGIGKTRLALEVAHRTKGRYGDGAIFVDLSGLNTSRLVIPTIGMSLGVDEAADVGAVDALLACVRGVQLLLVLDNFERLIGAASDLAAVLAKAPQLRVLITSRRPLRVRGEQVIEVGSLIPQSAPGDLPRPAAAIELFLDRAREASQTGWSSPVDLDAIGRLCRRLDGMPLAIELVAARTRVLGPSDLDRLPLAGAHPEGPALRDLPKRQETLETTVDWSLADTGPRVRRFFRSLAVFRGGFTIGAATAVCGGDDTEAALDALLDRSLVRRLLSAPDPRFALYEPIRDLVLDRLGAGERSRLEGRHAAWYADLATQADSKLLGRDQPAWLARVDAEYNNIRAAMDHALRSGDSETLSRIVGALWWYWQIRGLAPEGRSWAERTLEVEPALSSMRRAQVLQTLGCLLLYQRLAVDALPILRESRHHFLRCGDQRGVALVSNWLGVCETDLGHVGLVERHLNDARVAARLAEERTIEMWASLNLYGALALRGDVDGALALVEREMAMGMDAVDPQTATTMLIVRLWGAWIRDDPDSMLRLAPDTIKSAESVGDVSMSSTAWSFLGQAQTATGDLAGARASIDHSMGLLFSHGRDRDGTLNALIAAAVYLGAVGRSLDALRTWGLIDAWEQRGGYVPWPPERAARARLINSLRSRLDEMAAEAALLEGRALDVENPLSWVVARLGER